MQSPSQIQLIKKYGLSIDGHSGQHLLIDPNTQRKIVDLLDIRSGERVLEIGPGLGALSFEILTRGARLSSVEKDPRFVKVLEQEIAPYFPGRVKVYQEDILEFNWKKLGSVKIKVVSNLPYYITAPVLFDLIEQGPKISQAVLMMQKEVADRILASPGNKDYGRLSIGVRFACDVRHAFDVSAKCFTPQPKVDSSVLVFRFHDPKSIPKGFDQKLFHQIVQAAFSQRRKVLISVLSRDRNLGMERQGWERIFGRIGITPTARAEELLIKDFMRLTEELKAATKAGLTAKKGRVNMPPLIQN